MQDEDRTRSEFRRMLGASVALHVVLLVVLMVSPAPSAIAPPAAITVDLVAYAPAPAARAPAPPPEPESEPEPEPEPEAAPPPPRPKPAAVVLPERPSDPKPAPKPKAKPRPKRREVVLAPETDPGAEQSLDDLMAEMRRQAGEPRPEPVARAETPRPAPRGGVQVTPEQARWMGQVKAHIRRTWVVPMDFRDQALATHVVLSLDAQGALRGAPRITRTSGNLAFDDGVVEGIRRADPLPAPPEAGEFPFVFDSEDRY